MTCSQLFHLLLLSRQKLELTELVNLEIITALFDSHFPVGKWEKDGLLEDMVEWAYNAYKNYIHSFHGMLDFDEFVLFLADFIINHADNCSLEDPTKVDMEKAYAYCQKHEIVKEKNR